MARILTKGMGTGAHVTRNIGDEVRVYFSELKLGTYPTGGFSLNLESYFPKYFGGILLAPAGNKVFEYDKYNSKVVAKELTTGAEVSNSTDLSSLGNQQEIHSLTVVAEGGTFKLGIGDEDTSALTYTVTGASLATAINGLTGIEDATVVRTGESGEYTYTITYTKVQGTVPLSITDNSLTGDYTAITIDTIQKFTEGGISFIAWGY